MVTGLGVKPVLQAFPVAQTGSPLPPQMASQDIMSALSRKPVAHPVGRQAPVEHDTVALPGIRLVLQAMAQPPQLVAVLSGSQPLRALESQLEKPVLQTMEQAPPTHEGVPPVLEQAMPQPPQ